MAHNTIWEKNGLIYDCYGTVTIKEITEIQAELHESAMSDEVIYFIWDGSKIEHFDFEKIEDFDLLAVTDVASNSYKPHMKAALVGKDKTVRMGIKRYIETSRRFNSTWEHEIFETIEEAREWINS